MEKDKEEKLKITEATFHFEGEGEVEVRQLTEEELKKLEKKNDS